jgi:large subunit ribosomal protein L3
MTRFFDENGASLPVTVIKIDKHYVTGVNTQEKNGYTAVQVSTGTPRRAHKVTKAIKGHYQKAGVKLGSRLCEFRITEAQAESFKVGDTFGIELFKAGDKVDAMATSKGHGFSGVIRRHNFKSQRASHGNSLSHNAPGSIGQNQSPGRVFKGKKMAGQWGNTRVTVQNLEVVKVDTELNVLLVKGALPGAPGQVVIISPAVKASDNNVAA